MAFTFVGSASGTGSSINISGISFQAGDFGVLCDFGRQPGSQPGAVTPSGHTQDATAIGSGFSRGTITHKVLDGTETTLNGINASAANRKTYMVFRPSSPITGVTYVGATPENTAGNPVNQAVDPSAEAAAIVIGFMASQGGVSPRTMTPALNEIAGAGGGSPTDMYSHYAIYDSSPVAQTAYDMDDEGNDNTMILGYFKFDLAPTSGMFAVM